MTKVTAQTPASNGNISGALPTNEAPVVTQGAPPQGQNFNDHYAASLTQPAPAPGASSGGLPTNDTKVVNPGDPNQDTSKIYGDLGAHQAEVDFANASAAGWKFDAAGFDGLITELESRLKEDLEGMKDKIVTSYQIQSPGSDEGSQDFTTAANQSAIRFLQTHENSTAYLRSYVDILKQIRTAYANSDQAALDSIRESGRAALSPTQA
jgi:hypothetical protein